MTTTLTPLPTTAPVYPQLAVRVDPRNPNHHLWNNNGTWFIHYTVYPDAFTAERVRRSLKTRSLAEARHLRDQLFAEFRCAA